MKNSLPYRTVNESKFISEKSFKKFILPILSTMRETWIFSVVIVLVFNKLIKYGFAQTFTIGGLFDQPENNTRSQEEIMFEIAVNSIPQPSRVNRLFASHISHTRRYDAIQAQNHACEMLDNSVIAIFGPQPHELRPVVKSICDVKEIPHIQARYDSLQKRSACGINLYPHPTTLSKAYMDVIKKLGWTSFVLIYEDNSSLMRTSELLRPSKNLSIEIKQLPKSDDYRSVFHQIYKSNEVNIVLDCSIKKLPEVLKQSQQVGAMIEKYSYIITRTDLHTVDLDPYKYSGVKIYGFRLVNSLKPSVSAILKKISTQLPFYQIESAEKIITEAALTYDAVMLLGKILREEFLTLPVASTVNGTNSSTRLINDRTVPRCYDMNSWKFGLSIISEMKVAEMKGLSGLIKFDHEGFRTDLELQIIELTGEGLKEKGIWNYSQEDRMAFNNDHSQVILANFKNTTFKVVIPMTKPFGMRKGSASQLSGNDQFEGYAVDLVHELSLLLSFKYEILIQEDGSNGMKSSSPDGSVQWDGMMGKLLAKEADLAIGDLTITKDRSEYVEFSSPLMELGIAILFIKPAKENPSLFSFLFPFSDLVWYLVITASLSMGLQLYIMARISPYEWKNPHPCIINPEELQNQFTFSNALWFTLGALMQQGSEIAPISPSTRIAAGIWWFFILIMVSSYTANLAAFLTVENEVSPFSNAYELARQEKIHYGAKYPGTTYNFFKESQVPEFIKIYKSMEAHPKDVVNTNKEGKQRVLDEMGGYAFFMESTSIEYEKEQNCSLAQIGPLLDSKNYGIATRKEQWYSRKISDGVLLLQEKGILTNLKRKWWKEKYSKNCQEDKKNDADQLKLANVGGVFLVLIAGIVLAFLVMICELVFNLMIRKKHEQINLKRELFSELKSILISRSVKPARKLDEKSLLGNRNAVNESIPLYGDHDNPSPGDENGTTD